MVHRGGSSASAGSFCGCKGSSRMQGASAEAGILCGSNFSLAPQGLLPRAPFCKEPNRPGGYNQNRPKISRLRKLWDRKRRLGLALHKPLFAGQAADKGVMPLTEARRPSVFPDRGARATYKSESRHRQRGVITPKKGARAAYKSESRHRKSRAISFTKSLLRGAHTAYKVAHTVYKVGFPSVPPL